MNAFVRNLGIVFYATLFSAIATILLTAITRDVIALYFLCVLLIPLFSMGFVGLNIVSVISFLFKWNDKNEYCLKMVLATLFFIPMVLEYDFPLPIICFVASYVITISVITYFHMHDDQDSNNQIFS